jgi:CRISPR-associated protein Cas2
MVMFDLPVKTKTQRLRANQFRQFLLDLAYQRAQLSVYVRFSPSVNSLLPTIAKIKNNVPDGGEVRILTLTDRTWAHGLRFSHAHAVRPEDAPNQLTIF